jgi:hypothetical protein
MTHKVLTDIFTRQGNCRRDGDTVAVPKEAEACLFVSIGVESLIVERIIRLELDADVLTAITARRERYCVAYEDVRAVRFGDAESHTGY